MKFNLHFRSYIASPFWPEANRLVDIQKQSGMNRVRSEDKRESSLLKYLEKIGMDFKEYQQLERDAKKPWYYDKNGRIFIPKHHLEGCLVQATRSARAGARLNPDHLRCLLLVSNFTTDKYKCDEVFERFIVPKGSKGEVISNQRRFTSNEVISNFVASGKIDFDVNDVKVKSVVDLLTYAGKYVGVGSSRKMGYGRFSVEVVDKD